jgi:hypothetical protein
MTFRPSVAEERATALRELVPTAPATAWKSYSLLARCGFFVLGAVCGGALFGFFATIAQNWRTGAFLAGVCALATAEYLILRFRLFSAGLEEALWLGGALLLVAPIGGDSDKTVLLLLALATFAAGVRLLNPLCAPAGMLFFAFYVNEVVSGAVAAAVCAFVGVVALALLPLRWQRPSFDHALGGLVIVMPLAGYLFAKGTTYTLDWRVALALLLYAAAALVVGIRFRLHAPLIALFTTLGAFAWEVRELTGMRLETRLIVWGTMLLAVSIAIERFLKTPRGGITSRQLRDDHLFDLLQLAGTVAITPHERPAEHGGPVLEGGGSSFGGAGAGGDF